MPTDSISGKPKERVRTGWIRSVRQSRKIMFLSATDGEQEFQLTIKKGTPVEGEPKIGASFISRGVDSKTPRGSYEFLVSDFKVVGASDDEYPIQPKEHSAEFFRSIPGLRGQSAKYQAIWRLRHIASQAIHGYLSSQGFIQYFAPIMTSADCEGAGETFKVTSDWMESHLTVSAQLHGEVGMMSCGKIYTFGPCFRAEKSSGRRHLSEFWMVEPEMAFFGLEETMTLAEHVVCNALAKVWQYKQDFEKLRIDRERYSSMLDKSFARITYAQACQALTKTWGQDFTPQEEQKLCELYKGPVFVTRWPKEMKPFYMKTSGDIAECFDLIFPEVGELVGGSVREEDYDTLLARIEEQGIDKDSMSWYLQTRRWGTVPHAGFGLGLERLIMYICKLEKVHDAIPFPVHY